MNENDAKINKTDFSERNKMLEDENLKLQIELAKVMLELKHLKPTEQLEEKNKQLKEMIIERNEENRELKEYISRLEYENNDLKEYISGITGNTPEEVDCNVNNVNKSKIRHTIIVGEKINGQTYVRLDDFMSVVNDLQV